MGAEPFQKAGFQKRRENIGADMSEESCYCAATRAPCGYCENPKNSPDPAFRLKCNICYCDLIGELCLVCINEGLGSQLAHEFELARFSMTIANWCAENLGKLER